MSADATTDRVRPTYGTADAFRIEGWIGKIRSDQMEQFIERAMEVAREYGADLVCSVKVSDDAEVWRP